MSSNGGGIGGGRDPVDLLESIDTKLDDLIGIFEEALRPETEDDEEGEPIDKWRRGEVQRTAPDINSYLEQRMEAARSDEVVPPRYTGDRKPVDFYWDVYQSGIANIDEISNSLSENEFNVFVRKIAVQWGAAEELTEIIKPGSGFFGVHENTAAPVEIKFSESHMQWLDMYDSYWYWPTPTDLDNIEDEDVPFPAAPVTLALELEDGGLIANSGNREVSSILSNYVVKGQLDANQVNVRMARVIRRRPDLELPEEFTFLL